MLNKQKQIMCFAPRHAQRDNGCFLQDQAMKMCQQPTIVKFINFSPLCTGSNAMELAKIQKQEVNRSYITR